MSILPTATYRRLQKLPQDQSVWEGDRRTIDPRNTFAGELLELDLDNLDTDTECDCVLWVDGSQGMLRAVDLVSTESGPEATARALIRAMEKPQAPGSIPTRPQKIIVCDRELQFFLRGMLRDLNITVEFVPKLPFWDEVFEALMQLRNNPLNVASKWQSALEGSAKRMWKCAPWSVLEDHQILEVELNQWDISSLYVSVMGKGGMEYGLLFYRSLESLKRFREAVVNASSPHQLQEVFLIQDCLYLTYDQDEPEEFGFLVIHKTPTWDEVEPTFGSIHPLEGMRPFLYDEESQILLAGLDAVEQFMVQHQRKFKPAKFPALEGTYLIDGLTETPAFPVTVRSLPDLATELFMMDDEEDDSDALSSPEPLLSDDLVPEGAICWYGSVDWALYDQLKTIVKVYQPAAKAMARKADELPVLFLQTSRPKAKGVRELLEHQGGVTRVTLGKGEDFWGEEIDLGILETGDETLHLFTETPKHDPAYKKVIKKWLDRCKKNQQMCAIAIAEGVTGAARGKPQMKHIVALYEVPLVKAAELGVANLQMMPKFDFPFLSN